jgi:hypothetical protein
MSQPGEPSDRAESTEELAETGDELEGSETVSLLDAEVEAPINAAVQNPDSEREGTEGEGG